MEKNRCLLYTQFNDSEKRYKARYSVTHIIMRTVEIKCEIRLSNLIKQNPSHVCEVEF